MKDKYLYIKVSLFYLVCLLCSIFGLYMGLILASDKIKVTEIRNVLPKNEDKKLVEPDEVRQYVLEMARREKLNVNTVDKVVNCESHYRVDARSKTGKYLGLYQISSIHNVSDDCRLSAVCSTKWFIEKVKRDGNYLAWECYSLTS